MYIDKQLKLNVNGVPQFVSIRAEKEKAPLLIYLHGGPGDAAFPLVMTYNNYKFDGPVTIDIFLNDLYTLVDYLLPRFHQSSVYLVGHSWGSILGLRFVQAYPELVHTYIGCMLWHMLIKRTWKNLGGLIAPIKRTVG
ncbi:alpha/beta hydrolase [Enterocloster clostridioformis]